MYSSAKHSVKSRRKIVSQAADRVLSDTFLGTAALGSPRLGMGPDVSVADSGVGLDLCEKEQSALARRYVLTQRLETSEPWSHAGPRSVSPFAPCASSRVPHILDAARLDEDSVLWDLGCGDGRVLHEAAARYGCRCVGVEIDAPCLAESQKRAEAMGKAVSDVCSWHLRDVTALPAGALGADDAMDANTPSPTVVLLFITGHGLSALSGWLKHEWETAAKPFAIVTCVEALDTCVDVAGLHEASAADGGNPLFDQTTNPHDWFVYRDATHAKYGVFVTPPRGVSINEWVATKPKPAAADPSAAARATPRVARGVFDEADIASVEALVEKLQPGGFFDVDDHDATAYETTCVDEKKKMVVKHAETTDVSSADDDALAARLSAALLGDAASFEAPTDDAPSNPSNEAFETTTNLWSEFEDACHAHRSHRVVHLHACVEQDDPTSDAFSKHAPRARAKLLRAAYDADARFFFLARGRALFVRSAEYHAYEAGGGVVDPAHRDTGSVLTVSVVLETPSLMSDESDDTESDGATKKTRQKTTGGGVFFTRGAEGDFDETTFVDPSPPLRRGDAIVFPSEKRHGVTPLVGEGARRRSVVLELWEGGVTRKNRQE